MLTVEQLVQAAKANGAAAAALVKANPQVPGSAATPVVPGAGGAAPTPAGGGK